jgi:Cu+-exporting ATPase
MAQTIQPVQRQEILPITGMTCANCSATIERNVRKLPGIQEANVNLASERLNVVYDPTQLSHDEIVARVRKAGYDVPVVAEAETLEDAEASVACSSERCSRFHCWP